MCCPLKVLVLYISVFPSGFQNYYLHLFLLFCLLLDNLIIFLDPTLTYLLYFWLCFFILFLMLALRLRIYILNLSEPTKS